MGFVAHLTPSIAHFEIYLPKIPNTYELNFQYEKIILKNANKNFS